MQEKCAISTDFGKDENGDCEFVDYGLGQNLKDKRSVKCVK